MYKKETDNHYASALSFRKTIMIPKNEQIGPLCYYRQEDVWPNPYAIVDEGTVCFNLYYPHASRVSLRTYTDAFELSREGDCWVGRCKVGTGFIGIMLNVDGHEVLNPALPIGFGGNRPINFIQIPEKNTVIEPMDCKHGTLAIEYMKSRVTGKLERIYMYLPPDYEHTLDKVYPVLYLQHGHGENETTWVNQGKVNFIYDNLIAQGKAEPAIIVMCNGMVAFEEHDGIRVDVVNAFEKMLTTEVIPYIEGKYRTYGDKAHRAMAGLSMGSMQTSVITLQNQELFSYVGIFSGFVTDFLTGHQDHLQERYLKTYAQNMTYIFRAMGEEDIYFEAFCKDDALFERYNIKHERVIYPGYHEWKVWQHCLHDFAQKLFKDES